MMQEYRLEMKGINKSFTGMKALDDASLFLKPGEVHALLGINGAGKSTLIKVLSGVYSKDSGEIYKDGKLVAINNPQDSINLGISTVYQDPQMVESFTGYENIYLGSENNKKGSMTMMSRKQMRKNALELLEKYPLDIDIDKPVYSLSAIEREILAVLRALSHNCDVLILDEPTSILTEKEKHDLFDFVRLLKSKGVSIIYITHHLDEVAMICDAFTVYRGGKVIGHEEVIGGKVDANHIAEMMLGQRLGNLYPEKKDVVAKEVALSCEKINLANKLYDISLEARKGEILGMFGLVGSGIDEISKILFGAMHYNSGEIFVDGKMTKLKDTTDAINKGIYLVPGDRKAEGSIGNLEIAQNLTMAKLSRIVNKAQLVKRKEEVVHANELVERLEVATTSIRKHVGELSGGNQQKVVIGKGIFTEANVYIFAEPTVGVDVGAKRAIYNEMRALSKNACVIIVSSDPEEVLGNADKILVMNNGHITLNAKDSDTSLREMLVKATSNQ